MADPHCLSACQRTHHSPTTSTTSESLGRTTVFYGCFKKGEEQTAASVTLLMQDFQLKKTHYLTLSGMVWYMKPNNTHNTWGKKVGKQNKQWKGIIILICDDGKSMMVASAQSGLSSTKLIEINCEAKWSEAKKQMCSNNFTYCISGSSGLKKKNVFPRNPLPVPR